MKILILGSTGMLGSALLFELSRNNKVQIFATYRNEKIKYLLEKKIQNKRNKVKFIKLDILKISDLKLKKLISKIDVIINCVGLIKQKINSLKNDREALKLNSLLPLRLNNLRRKSQKIYQIATDCVFDGARGNYKENDKHNYQDIYGLSKSLGEINDLNFFNIRCSIIGNEIKTSFSLFAWFINRKKNSSINGYTNHIWNGLSTKVFSKILIEIIKNNIQLPNKFHLIPKDKVSKYILLNYIKKTKKISVKIKKFKTKTKIDRSLSTNYKKLNLKLWNLTFKKQLSIKEIINEFI